MIVVIGEALVDLVPGSDGPRAVPGGSPFNVAAGLGGLDIPVTLRTEFGDDEYGALLRSFLTERGVHADVSPADRTGTATVRIVGGEAEYDLDLPWTLPTAPLPAATRWLHVGSLATLIEPGRVAVEDAVREAVTRGIPVSYDPNLRPGEPVDVEAVRGLAAMCDVVKLSAADASLLDPTNGPAQVARSLLAGRTGLVVLTSGSAGASAYSGAGLDVRVPSPQVRVVDTIGAGDAFCSGMLAALHHGVTGRVGDVASMSAEAMERLLRAASEVAARTCTRAGAGAPLRAELGPTWPA